MLDRDQCRTARQVVPAPHLEPEPAHNVEEKELRAGKPDRNPGGQAARKEQCGQHRETQKTS